AAKHLPGIGRPPLRHEHLMRHHVLAPGALETQHVPGVVDFQVAYRYDDMHPRIVGVGIGTPQHDPRRMIDAGGESPAPVPARSASFGAISATRRITST